MNFLNYFLYLIDFIHKICLNITSEDFENGLRNLNLKNYENLLQRAFVGFKYNIDNDPYTKLKINQNDEIRISNIRHNTLIKNSHHKCNTVLNSIEEFLNGIIKNKKFLVEKAINNRNSSTQHNFNKVNNDFIKFLTNFCLKLKEIKLKLLIITNLENTFINLKKELELIDTNLVKNEANQQLLNKILYLKKQRNNEEYEIVLNIYLISCLYKDYFANNFFKDELFSQKQDFLNKKHFSLNNLINQNTNTNININNNLDNEILLQQLPKHGNNINEKDNNNLPIKISDPSTIISHIPNLFKKIYKPKVSRKKHSLNEKLLVLKEQNNNLGLNNIIEEKVDIISLKPKYNFEESFQLPLATYINKKNMKLNSIFFEFTKRENIDKSIIRKFRKTLAQSNYIQVDKESKIENSLFPEVTYKSKFWKKFCNSELIPPFFFKEEKIVFKSFCANYLLWLFKNEDFLIVFKRYLTLFMEDIILFFSRKFHNENQLCQALCYIYSMSSIFIDKNDSHSIEVEPELKKLVIDKLKFLEESRTFNFKPFIQERNVDEESQRVNPRFIILKQIPKKQVKPHFRIYKKIQNLNVNHLLNSNINLQKDEINFEMD